MENKKKPLQELFSGGDGYIFSVFVYGRAFLRYEVFEIILNARHACTFRGPALTTTIGGLGVPLESVLATSVVLQSTLSPVLTEALADSRS